MNPEKLNFINFSIRTIVIVIGCCVIITLAIRDNKCAKYELEEIKKRRKELEKFFKL